VTVITSSEDYVFGGYTPVSWNSSTEVSADHSYESFLFTLKNPHNLPPTKFSLTNKMRAIQCRVSYGPTFGYDGNICCFDNSDKNNDSYTYLGSNDCYENPTNLSGSTLFTGRYHFIAKDIDVYRVE
jgi:hypothetical protein